MRHYPVFLTMLCLAATIAGCDPHALAQSSSPSLYFFSTLAGTASLGGVDGQGGQARFNNPGGVAVDINGNLYVADTGNCTIRKITPTGLVTTLAGKPGQAGSSDGTGGEARFSNPVGITIDLAGNLFVADTGNSAIRKITPAGVVTTIAGNAPHSGTADGTGTAAFFRYPQGITVDAAGTLYVADTENNLIRKISAGGVVTTLAGAHGEAVSTDGTGSEARFTRPQGIVVDPAGNLYVSESTLIRKISPGGEVTSLAGIPKPIGSDEAFGSIDGNGSNARFSSPSGITRDATGNLYVADFFNCTIRKISPEGAVTTFAGFAGAVGFANGTGGQANFYYPRGITIDASGNLFVADTYNHNIRRITSAALVSTVAGLAPVLSTGSADGVREGARFYGSQGLAVGPVGEIYVADTRNHLIRKISPTGTVSTLAGAPGEAAFANGSGSSARFNFPTDVAVDPAGNVYVNDSRNFVVRKITPSGNVSTLAGKPGQAGTFDGAGDQALFSSLLGMAVDAKGVVFVSDLGKIRKITPDGQVSTLPTDPRDNYDSLALDSGGNLFATVGDYYGDSFGINKLTSTGTTRYFTISTNDNAPGRLAIDRSGNVFFTSPRNSTVSKVSVDGSLAEIAGSAYKNDNMDGIGQEAHFIAPTGIAVDAEGTVYVSDCDFNKPFPSNSGAIRKGQLAGPPIITSQPSNQSVAAGTTAQFSVNASGLPAPTYQWYIGNSAFTGAKDKTLSIPNVRSTDDGDYSVVVTNSLGSVTSTHATLTVAPTTTTSESTPRSSGGGGAMEAWFVLSLLTLGIMCRSTQSGARPPFHRVNRAFAARHSSALKSVPRGLRAR